MTSTHSNYIRCQLQALPDGSLQRIVSLNGMGMRREAIEFIHENLSGSARMIRSVRLNHDIVKEFLK